MNWADLKCRMQGGQWRVGEKAIEVYNIEHGEIYRSPQEPSFVSWVNLWKELDGTLKCAFTEASGDPAHWPPTCNFNTPGIDYYTKTLVSRDGGQNWTDTGWREPQDPLATRNSDHHWRRTVVMPDGSLIRQLPHAVAGVVKKSYVYLYDESLEADGSFYPFRQKKDVAVPWKRMAIWRSTDGGENWQEIFCDPDSDFWGSSPLLCQDGRLVIVGGACFTAPRKASVRESLDGGYYWSEPHLSAPADSEFADGIGEENELVELPDGRLLLVCRAGHYEQAYVTRTGPGQYEATDIKIAPFPRSGHPFLLKCSDGTIWWDGGTGCFVTLDSGVTWHKQRAGGGYYPQMVEVEPGCILHVTQRGIGDKPFPWPHDASIGQTRFNYRRADVLEQNNAGEPLALSVIDTPSNKDTHLHAWVRADGYSGLAFRIQPDRADYYVYMVQMQLPEAAEAAAEGKAKAFHLLGKVAGEQMTILRRRYIGQFPAGSWVQLQVRTQDDLVHGAVQVPPGCGYFTDTFHLAVRDNSLQEGRVGLVTAASTGAFKVLELVEDSKLIRDTWWK